jgi:hypothetical protein
MAIMAKQAKATKSEQEKQAAELATRIAKAQAESKEQAQMVALSKDEQTHAQQFGEAIGKMSQARVGYAMTMRDMAIYLAEPHFRMEGYAFEPNPKQKQFVRALFDWALETAYGKGTQVRISQDQTLNNAKTGLNNLCKAYNLSGYIEHNGEPFDTVAHLVDILNRDPRPTEKGAMPGGWNAAIGKARDIIARARKQAETDEDLAKILSGDGTAKPRSNGRPKQPISATRIEGIIADVPRIEPVDAGKIVRASLSRLNFDETASVVAELVSHLLSLVPVPIDSTPTKVAAKAEKARAMVQRLGTEFAEKAVDLVREARAAMIQPEAPAADVPAITHTDEVTAARGRKRAPRKVPAKVIQEQMTA